ncbi:DUF6227 family protein [Streptomyces sp. H10-C2]|uniref:DUF6227 family protein n=1 Tax=unclassified Streptomyces TaxID=2593676 RepID=UPI0024BB2FD9|nr:MULTISPECIES: DUF6227 family protein [unclassified Streptomyces]MDJ0347190.1 DUF6227 family protein [Streptomyces sp. PH10-H1]MDJ0370337.1 DUF6227 family protein [Streptomyces sp. H10-C2]
MTYPEPTTPRDDFSDRTPSDHIDGLLARAAQPAPIAEALLARLRTAIVHRTELVSNRYGKEPGRLLSRRTLRHVYLLPDGTTPVLWELEHDTGPVEHLVHEVFADESGVLVAEMDVDVRFGDLEHGPAVIDLPAIRMDLLFAPSSARRHRVYEEDNSADHAVRLLRRAVNPDLPGEAVRRRVLSAVGHDIAFAGNSSRRIDERSVGWTLYEHAFLLPCGEEISLWEVDHSMTTNRHPVCEVYDCMDTARDSAERRLESF